LTVALIPAVNGQHTEIVLTGVRIEKMAARNMADPLLSAIVRAKFRHGKRKDYSGTAGLIDAKEILPRNIHSPWPDIAIFQRLLCF
jgi:hypothetical protein